MAVNSSNDSLLHLKIPEGLYCYVTKPSSFIFNAYSITTTLLLLPLCIFVLYLGLQRQRQQRSTSAAAMTSHSDIFTYHMVAVELIGVLGDTFLFCGLYILGHVSLQYAGYFLMSFTWFGQTSLHTLTCVERYLAVVHPVTYLSLRRERGIRIRNISIGCAWLFSVGAAAGETSYLSFFLDVGAMIPSFIVVTFCSLSVLRVLIRPGPGEQRGDRVDQSKRRAFYTIMAIQGTLSLRCFGDLTWYVFHVQSICNCVCEVSYAWFDIPSSLVLPLLFLHRAGRLKCCKNNT